ncbi:ImmA/IrrE family metallo-endopeptidase [Schinkia azotoformans]|uniref:ImmA/IrrE family metallo-endopeptidase n=1 Tax=Schinkia azotoformans TaxID=1454 RepID=UPI002DBC0EF4|nr:ImmA/IrrE family metallo-endopeptidase [Schinkia azotoformans]MEC1718592.1 ImmA/IrrE family metallo-endopeptidase [Schinkia azotoformans]MEC1748259.1 ImmA/IrrE family metallo-endopeptidase [Schinkia azotoformans]MEC1760688.1 ImmA/IrrE family metallo-endopeptidase [Schinkia azotoformans]
MNKISFLTDLEMKDIESKANSKLIELHKNSRILGRHILNIVKKEATLLQSPFSDEEFCAFVCQKKGRLFVYINSQIPEEKQNFAAAHELYHIWFDKDFLKNPEMLKSNILNDETDNIRELRANLFAAMLLVPKHVLEQEIMFLEISKNEVTSEQVVELAHTFEVPYKAMVRRLYEIGYINKTVAEQLYSDTTNASFIRKKLQLDNGEAIKPVIHFEGLAKNAIDLYLAGFITPKRLRNLLSLLQKEPKDFGIELPDELPSEDEIDNLLEEDDG